MAKNWQLIYGCTLNEVHCLYLSNLTIFCRYFHGRCSSQLHSLILLVQAFTTMSHHIISIHPLSIHIPLWGRSSTQIFPCSEMLHCGKDSQEDAFLMITNLTYFSRQSFTIYCTYPHNMHQLLFYQPLQDLYFQWLLGLVNNSKNTDKQKSLDKYNFRNGVQ